MLDLPSDKDLSISSWPALSLWSMRPRGFEVEEAESEIIDSQHDLRSQRRSLPEKTYKTLNSSSSILNLQGQTSSSVMGRGPGGATPAPLPCCFVSAVSPRRSSLFHQGFFAGGTVSQRAAAGETGVDTVSQRA